jgi:hypothetical protein
MSFRTWGFCLTVLLGLALTAPDRFLHATGLSLGLSGVPGSPQIVFAPGGTYTIGDEDEGGFDDFQIDSSNSSGEAVGLRGDLDGTFTLGMITTMVSGVTIFEIAPVTGSGVMQIRDGDGFVFSGNYVWNDASTFSNSLTLNTQGVVNLSGTSYAGSNPELLQIASAGSAQLQVNGVLQIFGPRTLTELRAQGGSTNNYSGRLAIGCGRIGDFVWHDVNRNGIQDAGEPGIQGVKLTLRLKSTGQVLDMDVTDLNGLYLFEGLFANDYLVEVDASTVPAGFVPTLSNAGSDDALDSDGSPVCVTLPTSTSEDLTIDFGYFMPCTGRIGDFVWHDQDCDGIQDAGEPGLGGVTVRLRDSSGTVIATTVTDPNGAYLFDGLCAGDYTVDADESTLPPGFAPTAPNAGADDRDSDSVGGAEVAVSLAANNSVDLTIDFGFKRVGSIGDRVWLEAVDCNGVQDLGEPGINGVRVELRRAADNALIAFTCTTGDGNYSFQGLDTGACAPAGGYLVVVDLSSVALTGLVANFDADGGGDARTVVILGDGENRSDIDFSFCEVFRGLIGDFVWKDRDCDGVQDVGEPGIGGITVKLLDGLGNLVATTVTDPDGAYVFSGLRPGDYCVMLDLATLPAGVTPNSDLDGGDAAMACLTLGRDESRRDVDFGLCCEGAIGDFIWEDLDRDGVQDAGEPGIPGVVVVLRDKATGVELQRDTTDGGGLYRFERVCEGTYLIDIDESTVPTGLTLTRPNEGGDDERDSDCLLDASPVCVIQPMDGTINLSIDCGYVREQCSLVVDAGCIVPMPAPSGNNCQGKVVSMTLVYTGESCSATHHNQAADKVSCSGNPASDPSVFIRASNKSNPTDSKARVWFQGTVALGANFVAAASNAGANELSADTYVHVFASQGGALLQTIRFHTSCSQPLSVGDQFGSVLLVVLTTTLGGTVTLPDPQPPDPQDACTIPAPPAPPHCEGKIVELNLRYVGGDCNQSMHTQASGKVICSGNAGTNNNVRILVTGTSGSPTFLNQSGVDIGDVVDILASAGGQSQLPTDTLIRIFSSGGTQIMSIQVHTSCSQPVNLGDVYGSVQVFGIDTTLNDPVSLATEVTYSYRVTNTGTTVVTGVTVVDSVFGTVPGSPIAAIQPGQTVELTLMALVSASTTNTVTVTGQPGSCQAMDSVTVTVETPPPAPQECTSPIQAMRLRYTGPTVLNARVEFQARNFPSSPTIYQNVDLISGVTVLSSPLENGWTIDATAHGQTSLGSKTTILINGVAEVIHTSCSTPFVTGRPAPLDNPKGQPSTLWFVVDFTQR